MGNKKNKNLEQIYKLTNLAEKFSINELVDTSLSKNSQKTSEIINESNYKSEDGILILRTLLQKAKRLLNLYEGQNGNESFDSLINNYKPQIFWKDKPVVKRQLENWSKSKIKDLIVNINKTEIFLKKNSSIGLLLVFNFIYETSNFRQILAHPLSERFGSPQLTSAQTLTRSSTSPARRCTSAGGPLPTRPGCATWELRPAGAHPHAPWDPTLPACAPRHRELAGLHRDGAAAPRR